MRKDIRASSAYLDCVRLLPRIRNLRNMAGVVTLTPYKFMFRLGQSSGMNGGVSQLYNDDRVEIDQFLDYGLLVV